MKCDYHAFEGGYILIRDSPYMAKTDTDGEFTVSKLPYGTHKFRFWHERVGYLKDVSIGKQKTNRHGELTVRIDKPTAKLGTTKLPAKLFESSRGKNKVR